MRSILLLLVASCGRLAFEQSSPDDATTCDPVGHDEDGDGVDDACDGCPHVADAQQLDGDGDGINDLCDPRPDIAGESIAFFDAFANGTVDPGWRFSEPYEHTGDGVRINTLASAGYMMAYTVMLANDTVVMGGRLLTVASGHQLTLGAQTKPGTASHYCEMQGSTSDDLKVTWTEDGVVYNVIEGAPLAPLAPGTYALTLRYGIDVGCATTWPPGASVSGSPPVRTHNELGSFSVGLDHVVEYVIRIHSD